MILGSMCLNGLICKRGEISSCQVKLNDYRKRCFFEAAVSRVRSKLMAADMGRVLHSTMIEERLVTSPLIF